MSFYVKRLDYSAYDWHDMATVVTQMKENGGYKIEDAQTFVAQDIYNGIKGLVKEEVTVEYIKELMNGPDDVYLDVVVPDIIQMENNMVKVNPTRIELFSANHSGLGYQFHYESGYTYVSNYKIDEIEDKDVVYMVSEHIVNPGKGCDLIERCYHEPFKSLADAEKYLSEEMTDYHAECGREEVSGYKISVEDRTKLQENPWYKNNKLAVALMAEISANKEEYEELIEKYRYYNGISFVVEDLIKTKYDTYSKEMKDAFDYGIFCRIQEFLPAEVRVSYRNLFQEKKLPARELSDRALIQTFVYAKSDEDYEAIKKVLGEYECRIRMLTSGISREHRGNGFVLVSKAGEIKWYENGFELNRLDTEDTNPYHGKFQYNMGRVIDCFESYKYHNLFVDDFPSEEYVNSVEKVAMEKKQEYPFL